MGAAGGEFRDMYSYTQQLEYLSAEARSLKEAVGRGPYWA
jgi:hypothetical protein